MSLDDYKVLVIGPDGLEQWPLSKVQGFKEEPAKPTPAVYPVPTVKLVAGAPRRLVGLTEMLSDDVCECTINGIKGLIEVVTLNDDGPDAFVPRGYNLDYRCLFKTKPEGPETPNYGNDPLPGFTRPEGYRKRYFRDGRLYWEQSDLPDEEAPNQPKPVVVPSAPVVPASASSLGDTVIRKMNSAVFDPLIEWKDGLARVSCDIMVPMSRGETYFVSDSGQPPTNGFPAAYKYRPGEEVSILVYVSNSPDIVPADASKKGMATIVFGNPPQTA